MTRARRTLTTVIVGALAAGVLAGPAVAQQDKRSPDTADLAATVQRHRAHHDVRHPQDGRSPDTKDFAQGRPIVASTPFEVVKVRRVGAGFDWGDAAIGAGGALGVVLLGAGGATAVTRRRYRSISIAH